MNADRTTSYAAQETARKDEIAVIVNTIDKQEAKYAGLLPSNVTWADFRNAFLVSVQRNPRLLEADRQSLWLGLQDAASAGLKPDGREGALVIFGDDQEDEDGKVIESQAKGKKKVVWMPMVWGLTKQMRNTGNVASVRAKVIYKGEKVVITDKDGQETYEHVRTIDGGNEIDESDQNIIGAYAVVLYKDGFWDAEFMTRKSIDRVKAISRAKKGAAPWNKWYPQMAMKCPLRRLSVRVEKSSENERYFKAIQDDATMTIDGDAATEIGAAAIEQDNSIRQEFTQPPAKEKVAAKQEQPKQETQQKPKEEPKPQQAENTDRTQKTPETKQAEPVEIWAVDDVGEPVERTEPMNAVEFAEWFAATLMVSQNPDALREHNADAIGDAGADPKAAAIITDAIAKRAQYEAARAQSQQNATRTPERENGAAQAGQPVSETKADTGKPKRKAIEVPLTPKKAQHWGNYGPLAKAEIQDLTDEADIADWIAVNQPTYRGKACEIAIDNWLRYRREALGIGPTVPMDTPGMTIPELVASIKAQVSTLETDAAILEWSKSPSVRTAMLEIQRVDKVAFTDLIAFIDDRRLAVSPPDPPQ